MARQTKTVDVIFSTRLGIDHENLRRSLLDDGARDPAFQRILGTLRSKADNAIALTDCLFPVLDPAHEDIIIQCFPPFIDDDDGRCPIKSLLNPVEEIQHGRGARRRIIEDRGHIKANRFLRQIG